MKVLKKIPKKVEQKTVVDYIICDICEEQVEGKNGWDSTEVDIKGHIGSTFPEADCRETYIIDCCGSCFTDKIVPLVEKTFGIKFRQMSTDDRQDTLDY